MNCQDDENNEKTKIKRIQKIDHTQKSILNSKQNNVQSISINDSLSKSCYVSLCCRSKLTYEMLNEE